MAPIVGTQPLPQGQGLELSSQFTYRVGLVFLTKGSSTPSDTMTPLSPSEHPHFPLCVALPLGIVGSLYLFFPPSSSTSLSSHSILLFIA